MIANATMGIHYFFGKHLPAYKILSLCMPTYIYKTVRLKTSMHNIYIEEKKPCVLKN